MRIMYYLNLCILVSRKTDFNQPATNLVLHYIVVSATEEKYSVIREHMAEGL